MAPQSGEPDRRAKKRKEGPQDAASSKPALGKDGGGARFHPKRVKVHDARSLRAQPADAAMSNGELDLQAFLNAREFEIKALTEGMRRSKAVNNRRAFQLVPRSLRRRTASHNIKKLPHRLRARTRREQVDDNTPNVEARRRKPKTARGRIRAEMAKRLAILARKKRRRKLREVKEQTQDDKVSPVMRQLIETRPARPKIRRNLLNDPLKPKARFRKRQTEKTWLPTHLWHVKRAKMTPPKEPLWRFAVPLTPTEKVYRPTHRASQAKGAIVWDMSYMSTIGLYGHEAGIQRTLKAFGLSHDSLWDQRGKKWREGRRKWSGILSKQQNGDARRQIGPATILWNPESVTSANAEEATAPASNVQRTVYIRLHPACFLEVFNILVRLTKRETPRLYVEDLRFEIGSIELTGPGAAETLLGVLRPYPNGNAKEAHAKSFESLTATNSTILPADSVLGFVSQDPRLHYPPRPAVAGSTNNASSSASLDDLKTLIDESQPSPFRLFDRNARFKASCFPSQKALNRRKGENPPGQPLEVTNADPPFPVVIFTSNSSAAKSPASTTWTLLVPWKCVLPIWYSIVHYPLSTGGNPRLGGLNELRQVTFERGLPWFPGDFPGTDAGSEWELEQRQKRKADWERRPKSKRVAWETLDLGIGRKGEIGSGWACEFERLFAPPKVTDIRGTVTESETLATNDRDHVATTRSLGESPTPLLLKRIQRVSGSSFHSLATGKTNTPLAPYSIITVQISLSGRGVVGPCARVYCLPARRSAASARATTQLEVPQYHVLPENLRDQWLDKINDICKSSSPTTQHKTQKSSATMLSRSADYNANKLRLAKSLLTEKSPFPPPEKATGRQSNSDHPLVPNEEDLIGFVTKGEFSLAEGRGVAIASISAERALQNLNGHDCGEGRVCIVRNAGETIGWIGKWRVI